MNEDKFASLQIQYGKYDPHSFSSIVSRHALAVLDLKVAVKQKSIYGILEIGKRMGRINDEWTSLVCYYFGGGQEFQDVICKAIEMLTKELVHWLNNQPQRPSFEQVLIQITKLFNRLAQRQSKDREIQVLLYTYVVCLKGAWEMDKISEGYYVKATDCLLAAKSLGHWLDVHV